MEKKMKINFTFRFFFLEMVLFFNSGIQEANESHTSNT